MKESRKSQRSMLLLLTVIGLLIVAGCNYISKQVELNKQEEIDSAAEPISKQAFKLNTIIAITIYDSRDESLLDGAMAICDQYEQICSRTLETSELYQLNEGLLSKADGNKSGFIISEELAQIIQAGLYYSSLSKGAFDITVEPSTSLWDFTSTDSVVPDKVLIEKAVKEVGYQDMSLDQTRVSWAKENMGIDLGAIAKGYIADKIKEYLLDHGVKSAMINLGGNVLTVGEKPSGEAFVIGIQKPFADRNEIVATMDIRDMSVVSSGIYERCFTQDGVLYHHIIDPTTGYPYQNNLISVTIISPKSVDGDGLSTTCFALGLEEGMKLIHSLENTYAIFITEDYTLHYTEGFFEHITVTEVE